MKSIFIRSIILTFIFLGIFVGCKVDEIAVTPTPTLPTVFSPKAFGTVPEKYYVGLVSSTKSDLGLLINDPLLQQQIAVFGKKNSTGELTLPQNILVTMPTKGLWTLNELDGNYYPKSIQTSSGALLEFSNFNEIKKTFSVKISETSSKKVLFEKDELVVDVNLFESVKAISSKAKNLRIDGTIPRALTIADIAYVGANLFGCVFGAASVAAQVGSGVTLVAAPLTALGAYNTYQNCKGTLEAVKNLAEGKPAFGCVSGDDIGNSTASYVESLASYLGGGGLAGLATGILPQAMGNALQSQNGLCDPTGNPAHSTGDPHITTLDGLHYDFHGHGEFVAVRSITDNFEVQVRQEDIGNTGRATMNTAVAVQTGSDKICVTVKPDRLFINNQLQDLATFTTLALKDGASIAKAKEKNFDVLNVRNKGGDLVKIRFHGSYLLDYSFYVVDNRKGKVEGVTGNYDDNKDNDVQVRNGKVLSGQSTGIKFNDMYPTFADSWRITQANSLFYYDAGKNTDSYTQRDFPRTSETLTADQKSKAEATCRAAGVVDEPFLTNCIFDVAITGDANLASSSFWGQQVDARVASLPIPIIQEAINIKAMATQNIGSFILKDDGTLWVSGWSNHGQFGIGKEWYQFDTGKKFVKIMDGIRDIARSNYAAHMLFLKNDNSVWAAGYNSEGQIGNGVTDRDNVLTAVKIMTDAKSLFVGEYQSFVIKNDNSLWAFGTNSSGQLGNGKKVSQYVPVKVADDVQSVAISYFTTLILKTDNSLWATGSQLYGITGKPLTISDIVIPIKIMDNVKAIACGTYHSMIIKTDNSLWASGENYGGQLGLGNNKNVDAFTKVMDNAKIVVASGGHSFVIKTDNTLWGTGRNGGQLGGGSQLGDGTSTDINVFKQVATGVKDVVTAYAQGGAGSTFIIKTDNTLWATGGNIAGQLGDGTDISRSVFVPINVK